MKKLFDWLNYSIGGLAVCTALCWIAAAAFFLAYEKSLATLEVISNWVGLAFLFVIGAYAAASLPLAVFGTLFLICAVFASAGRGSVNVRRRKTLEEIEIQETELQRAAIRKVIEQKKSL